MNPMTVMQMDIDSAKQTVDKWKELRSQSDQEHNEEKKLVMLNKENISLRESLKQMNSSLTKFIELLKHFKIKKMGKPKYGIENLSTDYKLRARGAEEKTLNVSSIFMTNTYIYTDNFFIFARNLPLKYL